MLHHPLLMGNMINLSMSGRKQLLSFPALVRCIHLSCSRCTTGCQKSFGHENCQRTSHANILACHPLLSQHIYCNKVPLNLDFLTRQKQREISSLCTHPSCTIHCFHIYHQQLCNFSQSRSTADKCHPALDSFTNRISRHCNRYEMCMQHLYIRPHKC